MRRNRTHGLFVQGGVRLDHLADVILSRYHNARITENMVRLDLGVPEPEVVVAPVSAAESATHFHLPHMEAVRGVSDKVDLLLDELKTHPDIKALHRSFEKKQKANSSASSAAAQFEDAERNELQALLAKGPTKARQRPAFDYSAPEYQQMCRAYEAACERLVALGEHPPTVD